MNQASQTLNTAAQQANQACHPAVAQAIRDYCEVRKCVQAGTMGSGNLALYRDYVRAKHHIYHGAPYRGQ